jgi:hypothetical protein
MQIWIAQSGYNSSWSVARSKIVRLTAQTLSSIRRLHTLLLRNPIFLIRRKVYIGLEHKQVIRLQVQINEISSASRDFTRSMLYFLRIKLEMRMPTKLTLRSIPNHEKPTN